MPVHDWTAVEDGIFHDFHYSWITHIKEILNAGLLPPGYYGLAEQQGDELRSAKTHAWRHIAIRHVSHHRVIALVEIVSPANKDRPSSVLAFANKARSALGLDVHLLIVDLFPPGKHDPHGIHAAIWKTLGRDKASPPAGNPLCLMSYVAMAPPTAYVEWTRVGASLPDMSLFIDAKHYINVPLEKTYQTAYRGVPEYWRTFIEQHRPPQRRSGKQR